MSKNSDFLRLGPYSRKNSIRTGIETKIGQTEGNRAKTAVSRALKRQQCVDHARGCAPVAGRTRAYHVRQPLHSRGSAVSVRLGSRLRFGSALQGTCVVTLLELRCSSRRSTSVRHLSRRPPTLAARPVFFLLCPLQSLTHSPF